MLWLLYSESIMKLNQSTSAVSRIDSAIQEEDRNSVQQEGTTTTTTEDDEDYAFSKGTVIYYVN